MPSVKRYPWSELSVGDSRTLPSVPSRTALYSSLRHFRDTCLALGYSNALMPRYALSWDVHSDGLGVTITRLPDGPLASGPGMRGRRRLEVDPAAVEQRSILAAFDAHLEAQEARQAAGLRREMTPLDLVTRARLHDALAGTDLAGTMADLDSSLVDTDNLAWTAPGRPTRRRATDDPSSPVPPRQPCPKADLPYDLALASRLARCIPSQA
jgi:hypothetical protein